MVHLGRIFEFGELLFYGKSLWIDKNLDKNILITTIFTRLILKLSFDYDYECKERKLTDKNIVQ